LWLEDDARLRQKFGNLAFGEISRYNTSMSQEREKSIDELFEESTPIEEALRSAVQKALLRHKKLGNPIAVWENSKLVWIPPEKIQSTGIEEDDPAEAENT
jgi:hypothetical protein